MKKIYQLRIILSAFLKNGKLLILTLFFILSFSAKAQLLSGLNPYCVSSNPTYKVDPNSIPASLVYTEARWICSDPTVSISGNPSPLTLSKVLYKNPGIAAGVTLKVEFYNNGTFVGQSNVITFVAPEIPSLPSYYVTKTNDYCTSQYHIIYLNVTTSDTSGSTSYYISPTVQDPSVIVTKTSNYTFELKLPLNGQNYFLYNITSTTAPSGCLSNAVSSTSYGNAVSLNLTNCANNTPAVNYDFTIAPNPYSNGYLTILAPVVTPSFTAVCRIFNSSGSLVTTFTLSYSSTGYQLKANVPGLTSGNYIVHVTYANGNVKTKNLIVI